MVALADAMVANYERARSAHGRTVTYSDGNHSVSLTIVEGRTMTELADSDHSTTVKSYIRDFLILASELVLNSVTVLPKPGHRITEQDGAVYEATRLVGEPCYRFSDPTRKILRVHVQFIQETP